MIESDDDEEVHYYQFCLSYKLVSDNRIDYALLSSK